MESCPVEPGTSAIDKWFHFPLLLLTLQHHSELSQSVWFVPGTAPEEAEMVHTRSNSVSGAAVPSLPQGPAPLPLCWPAQQILQSRAPCGRRLHSAQGLVTLPGVTPELKPLLLQGFCVTLSFQPSDCFHFCWSFLMLVTKTKTDIL